MRARQTIFFSHFSRWVSGSKSQNAVLGLHLRLEMSIFFNVLIVSENVLLKINSLIVRRAIMEMNSVVKLMYDNTYLNSQFRSSVLLRNPGYPNEIIISNLVLNIVMLFDFATHTHTHYIHWHAFGESYGDSTQMDV